MSKNKYGIMGPNSGKIGTVVAYTWKGKEVMRGYSRLMTNPKTPAQQLHRAKFKSISLLASDLLPMIKRGFGQMADVQSSTETGLFIKHNWPIVEATSEDAVNIPLEAVVVSKGDLPGVAFGEPQLTGSGQQRTVSVDFATVDKEGTANDDYVYLGLYCLAEKTSQLSAPVKRFDQLVEVKIPKMMHGKEVHLYGFAIGSDFNRLHNNEASDSLYIGTITP